MQTIKDLPYAQYGDRVMRLDLFLPDKPETKRPTIMWVRGGGWRDGNKNVESPGPGIAAEGFVGAVIEYRGSAEAIAPGNVHDCKAALRWLRANPAKYGIDPDRIGASGGSAGGHLVALLGTTNGVKELEGNGGNPTMSSDVRAVCDFCGPTDLTRIAIPAIRKEFSVLYDVTAEYLGGPVEQRTDLAHLVSPLHHASKATAPTYIIHGDVDNVVPVEESIIFHDALKKLGVDSTLHVAKGINHGLSWDYFADKVIPFFRRTLTN